MLKQAQIEIPLKAVIEGKPEVDIPAGPCWMLEGRHWVKFVWRENGERRVAEIPLRQFERLRMTGACVPI